MGTLKGDAAIEEPAPNRPGVLSLFPHTRKAGRIAHLIIPEPCAQLCRAEDAG